MFFLEYILSFGRNTGMRPRKTIKTMTIAMETITTDILTANL